MGSTLIKTGVVSYLSNNSPTGVFQRVAKSLEKKKYGNWFHSRTSARLRSTTVSGARYTVLVHPSSVYSKYHLLQGTVPLDFLLRYEGEDCTNLDKIVYVCCALTNLCPSVTLNPH